MLQAEATRRSGEGRRLRRAFTNALALPLENGHDPQVETFFRAGLIAQVGFIIVALAGVGLVLVSAGPSFARFGQLLRIAI